MTEDSVTTIDHEALKALEAVLGSERTSGFIAEYIVAAQRLHRELCKAGAVRDWDGAYRPAHNLVSNAGNFGALKVAVLADRVQKALRQHDAEAVETALAPLEAALVEAATELRSLYPLPDREP